MLYRLHTEDKNRIEVEKLVSDVFPGFSIYEQTGYYEGVAEKSICIEVDGFTVDDVKIAQLCRDICTMNQQKTILVQQVWSESCLIDINGKVNAV